MRFKLRRTKQNSHAKQRHHIKSKPNRAREHSNRTSDHTQSAPDLFREAPTKTFRDQSQAPATGQNPQAPTPDKTETADRSRVERDEEPKKGNSGRASPRGRGGAELTLRGSGGISASGRGNPPSGTREEGTQARLSSEAPSSTCAFPRTAPPSAAAAAGSRSDSRSNCTGEHCSRRRRWKMRERAISPRFDREEEKI